MMKFFGLSLLLVSTAWTASLPTSLAQSKPFDERIVGGHAVSISKHPHQVSLRHKNSVTSAFSHTCGGSIYTENVVITAAHCVINRLAENFIIVAGTETRNGADGVVVRVDKIIMHENYNGSIYDNDVSLMILSSPLPLNGVTIASITLAAKAPEHGVKSVVTGWGTTSAGGFSSDQLLEVEVPIVSNAHCTEAYGPDRILNSMLCAGFEGVGGKDACQGDSGGPLLVNLQLAGIVSWGRSCALPDHPGVYANVPYLKNWIETNVNKQFSEKYSFL